MSLFRRVTRYRITPTQDPRENRLTEVTAAVLERVDGLAYDVVDEVLATAAATAREQLSDLRDTGAAANLEHARGEEHTELEQACDTLEMHLNATASSTVRGCASTRRSRPRR
jgi:hypothetical protein